MAHLPFIVKLFASCFTMTEDPLCRLRSARMMHACRTLSARTDSSFSSFADSESVVLPGTSSDTGTGTSNTGTSTGTMSWCPCEDEFDLKRSSKCWVDRMGGRRLHEKDTRSNQRKRLREDSSYLRNTSSVTDQEASYFANFTARDGEEPRRKKQHVSLSPDNLSESGCLVKRAGLSKVESFLSSKTKATLASFRRELNYVKSQLNISQARCELLQDENQWLRANMPDEEDGLLRHEVEMLQANKYQLALENAYLIRERERLLQLVKYFQN